MPPLIIPPRFCLFSCAGETGATLPDPAMAEEASDSAPWQLKSRNGLGFHGAVQLSDEEEEEEEEADDEKAMTE